MPPLGLCPQQHSVKQDHSPHHKLQGAKMEVNDSPVHYREKMRNGGYPTPDHDEEFLGSNRLLDQEPSESSLNLDFDTGALVVSKQNDRFHSNCDPDKALVKRSASYGGKDICLYKKPEESVTGSVSVDKTCSLSDSGGQSLYEVTGPNVNTGVSYYQSAEVVKVEVHSEETHYVSTSYDSARSGPSKDRWGSEGSVGRGRNLTMPSSNRYNRDGRSASPVVKNLRVVKSFSGSSRRGSVSEIASVTQPESPYSQKRGTFSPEASANWDQQPAVLYRDNSWKSQAPGNWEERRATYSRESSKKGRSNGEASFTQSDATRRFRNWDKQAAARPSVGRDDSWNSRGGSSHSRHKKTSSGELASVTQPDSNYRGSPNASWADRGGSSYRSLHNSFRKEEREFSPQNSFRKDERGFSPHNSFRRDERAFSPDNSFRKDERGFSPHNSFRKDERGFSPHNSFQRHQDDRSGHSPHGSFQKNVEDRLSPHNSIRSGGRGGEASPSFCRSLTAATPNDSFRSSRDEGRTVPAASNSFRSSRHEGRMVPAPSSSFRSHRSTGNSSRGPRHAYSASPHNSFRGEVVSSPHDSFRESSHERSYNASYRGFRSSPSNSIRREDVIVSSPHNSFRSSTEGDNRMAVLNGSRRGAAAGGDVPQDSVADFHSSFAEDHAPPYNQNSYGSGTYDQYNPNNSWRHSDGGELRSDYRNNSSWRESDDRAGYDNYVADERVEYTCTEYTQESSWGVSYQTSEQSQVHSSGEAQFRNRYEHRRENVLRQHSWSKSRGGHHHEATYNSQHTEHDHHHYHHHDSNIYGDRDDPRLGQWNTEDDAPSRRHRGEHPGDFRREAPARIKRSIANEGSGHRRTMRECGPSHRRTMTETGPFPSHRRTPTNVDPSYYYQREAPSVGGRRLPSRSKSDMTGLQSLSNHSRRGLPGQSGHSGGIGSSGHSSCRKMPARCNSNVSELTHDTSLRCSLPCCYATRGGGLGEELLVEVFPGVEVPLRRAHETQNAVSSGFIMPVSCMACCNLDLYAIADVSYFVCPNCKSICNVDDEQCFDGRVVERHGLGLGFTSETLFCMKSEMMVGGSPPARAAASGSAY